MTVYVIDTNVIRVIVRYYYRTSFPSFWNGFDEALQSGSIISVDEVYNELRKSDPLIINWCNQHKSIFQTPTAEEAKFVTEIFQEQRFQSLLGRNRRLGSFSVADPFLIAKANFIEDGCVLTNESRDPNKIKIPRVCRHFGVDSVDLDGFMQREGWTF